MRIPSSAIVLSVLTIAVPAFVGACASSGVDRTQATAESMKDTRQAIAQASGQIDTTVASLNEVVKTASTDPGPAYKSFTSNLKSLEGMAADVKSRADAMRSRADAYYKAWEQELGTMSNADLKAAGQSRLAAARESFKKINTSMQSAKAAFDPFMADLRDIRKALDVDLTSRGIGAVSPTIGKASKDADVVQKHARDVLAEFDRVIGEMSPKPTK